MTDSLVGSSPALDRLVALSRELRECPSCQGAGMVPLGEHRVTHDMAMDAGEPTMEGMSCGVEFGPCDQCGGGGLVDSDVANEIDRAVLDLSRSPEPDGLRNKFTSVRSCDRWNGPARGAELPCREVQGSTPSQWCWSCLIPWLIEQAWPTGADKPNPEMPK